MYSIFHIEGGLGKHVMATTVAKQIKEQHPDRDLIVICAYPELFLNLDFVDRVYKLGFTSYFYQDYIEDKDSLIFRHEPYFSQTHIKKEKHLIESWCELYEVEKPEEIKPILELNHSQLLQGSKLWMRQKPLMIIQTNGGTQNQNAFSWARDMPEEVFHHLVSIYANDYHIIQVCENKNQVLRNDIEALYERIPDSQLTALVMASAKRVLIDSALQHIAAAFDLKSTVLWIGTSPDLYGYNMHNNIIAKIDRKKMLHDAYMHDYNIQGSLHESPIKPGEQIFDIEQIIQSINE